MSLMAFPYSEQVVNIMAGGQFTLIYAADLDFRDGMVRVHTGTGQIVIDGQTYEGVGNFGSVGAIKESDNSSGPMTLDLVLSGLDSDIVNDALVDRCRGRPARVMIMVSDAEGNQAVDIIFSGRMDAAKFSYGLEDSSITIPVIDRMSEWSRRNIQRWTDENHQLRHPGDRFFFAVAQLSEWPLYWGNSKNAPSFEYN